MKTNSEIIVNKWKNNDWKTSKIRIYFLSNYFILTFIKKYFNWYKSLTWSTYLCKIYLKYFCSTSEVKPLGMLPDIWHLKKRQKWQISQLQQLVDSLDFRDFRNSKITKIQRTKYKFCNFSHELDIIQVNLHDPFTGSSICLVDFSRLAISKPLNPGKSYIHL